MKYYDPSWKKDRDHEKIVADKKRDEQNAKAVRDHFAKHPYKAAESGEKTASFVGFGAHYTSTKGKALGRRRPGQSKLAKAKLGQSASTVKGRKKGKRKKGSTSITPPVLPSRSYYEAKTSKPDHSPRIAAIASQLEQIEEKLEKQAADQERTFDVRRQRLLGERIGHLKAQRSKLRDELYRLS